jgi:hypothetical protein
LRLVFARQDRAKGSCSRMRWGLLGQGREGGVRGGSNPVGRESVPPLVKIETPLETPPFLTSHRCRSAASTRAFSLSSLTTRYT